MRPLILYFNELSVPAPTVTQQELRSWTSCVLSLVAALKKVDHNQSEYNLAFPQGAWHALYADKPLCIWLKEFIRTEHYLWLLAKIRHINPPNDLLRQVYFQGNATIGLTFARVAESWAFSFPKENSPWLSHDVTAREYHEQDDGDISDDECQVAHFASEQHVDYWQEEFRDWGRDVAGNNAISIVSGYPIEMYPIDHGYPHVHLIDAQSYKTLAKFRIDQFERMEGLPKWDNEVRIWIEQNSASLMLSWARCQRGGHPYKITETPA